MCTAYVPIDLEETDAWDDGPSGSAALVDELRTVNVQEYLSPASFVA